MVGRKKGGKKRQMSEGRQGQISRKIRVWQKEHSDGLLAMSRLSSEIGGVRQMQTAIVMTFWRGAVALTSYAPNSISPLDIYLLRSEHLRRILGDDCREEAEMSESSRRVVLLHPVLWL